MNEEETTTTSVIDCEIIRRKIDKIIKRIKDDEDDTAPSNVVYSDIDQLFADDGSLKYFKKQIWSEEDLAEEYGLSKADVTRVIDELYPYLCYNGRISRRLNALMATVTHLGKAYLSQKTEIAKREEDIKTLNDIIDSRSVWKCTVIQNEPQEELSCEQKLFYYKLIAPIISAILFFAGFVLRGFLQ